MQDEIHILSLDNDLFNSATSLKIENENKNTKIEKEKERIAIEENNNSSENKKFSFLKDLQNYSQKTRKYI